MKVSQIVDCQALAREFLSQPELLADVFPESDQEQAAKGVVQRYTGARSALDEERMLKVGALRLLGASDREIAAACHCTTRTIPILLRELEKSGRLTALKERLVDITGDNAERAGLALRGLLGRAQDGEVSLDLAAMIKAVATAAGILTEKVQLLTGSATEIVEVKVGAGRAELEAFARAHALPIEAEVVADKRANESESIAQVGFAGDLGANGGARYGVDTQEAAAVPAVILPTADQPGPGLGAAGAQEGAGGVREIPAAPQQPMGS